LTSAKWSFGFGDRAKSDAAHEVALVGARRERVPGRSQLVDVQVRVVTVAAVALLEFVTRRVQDRERATRVDGFGDDGDGNHVDIVGVGSKRAAVHYDVVTH
jgi:hypothetical protein